MLMRTVMMYARPVLIGAGILVFLFYLLMIYALMAAASMEDRALEEYEWADQARAIEEWKNKRKARQAR